MTTTYLGQLFDLQAVAAASTCAVRLVGDERLSAVLWRLIMAHEPPPAVLERLAEEQAQTPTAVVELFRTLIEEAVTSERNHLRGAREALRQEVYIPYARACLEVLEAADLYCFAGMED